MKANSAITTVRKKNISAINSIRALGEMISPMYWPIDFPWWRAEMIRVPKSCTAPIKMEPNTTHSIAGSQPQITAIAGPMMGDEPAIEV